MRFSSSVIGNKCFSSLLTGNTCFSSSFTGTRVFLPYLQETHVILPHLQEHVFFFLTYWKHVFFFLTSRKNMFFSSRFAEFNKLNLCRFYIRVYNRYSVAQNCEQLCGIAPNCSRTARYWAALCEIARNCVEFTGLASKIHLRWKPQFYSLFNMNKGNFSIVQFPERQLPKGQVRPSEAAQALMGVGGVLQLRWAAGPTTAARTDLVSCRLGYYTVGRFPLGSCRLGKTQVRKDT